MSDNKLTDASLPLLAEAFGLMTSLHRLDISDNVVRTDSHSHLYIPIPYACAELWPRPPRFSRGATLPALAALIVSVPLESLAPTPRCGPPYPLT